MGSQPQNLAETEILIKIIEIDLREIGMSSKEIYNLSSDEVEQYLGIINAKRDIQRKEFEKL